MTLKLLFKHNRDGEMEKILANISDNHKMLK